MTKIAVTLAAVLVLALPASASAGHRSHHHVPSGNSGIDQYTEVLPGAGGNQSTGGGNGGGGGNSSAVSPSVMRTLSSLGSAGQGAARLAAATAPNVHVGGAGSSAAGGGAASAGDGHGSGTSATAGTANGSSGSVASGSDSGSGAGAVGAELTGAGADAGMGIWLPIILGSTLVAALAVALVRWRRGPHQTT